ncbi:hypothetical protein CC77DRAFT_158049 [Alternaria alternata]|uniref:Helix-turn-helix-domain containing protein type n=2 Tax=Alternaria alternata complex TaxID=187734 RepID=A0A177DKD6_ALTAL|nr:hypothetical protein CC77DRAFT_158049 [Alternaria alternata]RYN31750.1 hypothetical protein AA0115_g4087 [Alternaria tenuissima]OAG19319.1 hypothetical protein CC77DRAFT_158049 [Alternaria alternata]RYN55233.1 hypothetical protein AA0114_g3521 [Alternaria tenuissima]RYN56255.1 hypothetical protein AA0118_g8172 [Alternaria tenuissima]RYN96212.1 hypothetical protein AA0120_g3265 [Alternaria tenuissima]
MSTYSFYQATIPQLRGTAKSAVSFLTAAKDEQSKNTSLPSGADVLNAQIGDMLPLRMQPILVAKFSLEGIDQHKLSSASSPSMDPSSFSSIDDLINFFKQLIAVYDAVDEKAFSESADKGLEVSVAGKSLKMTSTADFYNSFAVPNGYFHLNAMYMLLRSKGFTLGKGTYVKPFFSEQAAKDWAPLMG